MPSRGMNAKKSDLISDPDAKHLNTTLNIDIYIYALSRHERKEKRSD